MVVWFGRENAVLLFTQPRSNFRVSVKFMVSSKHGTGQAVARAWSFRTMN